jgi:hypothetical protein
MQASTFVSPSDRRLKTDVEIARIIEDHGAAYQNLWNIQPVSFVWRADERADIGLIAQDVQEAVADYPEFANLVRPVSDNSQVYLGVDYSKLSLVALMMAKKNRADLAELPRDGVAGLAALANTVDTNKETLDGLIGLLGDLPALAACPTGPYLVAILKALYEQVRLLTNKVRDAAAPAPPVVAPWPDGAVG